MPKHKNTSVPVYATTLALSESTKIKGVVKQSALERKALAYIERNPGCGWRSVAARYGWTHRTALVVIRGLLKDLQLAGDVDKMEISAPVPEPSP